MTKDEIIASLLDQLKNANSQISTLTGRVNELLAKVAELAAVVKSAQEAGDKKGAALEKARSIRRKARGNNGTKRDLHEE